MAGKYDWKPGQGVRSAGDVFNLIVMENGMLIGTLTGAGGGRGGARRTDHRPGKTARGIEDILRDPAENHRGAFG